MPSEEERYIALMAWLCPDDETPAPLDEEMLRQFALRADGDVMIWPEGDYSLPPFILSVGEGEFGPGTLLVNGETLTGAEPTWIGWIWDHFQ